MALSGNLKKVLRKSSFPLLDQNGQQLWAELIQALEANLTATIAEVKALVQGFFSNVLDDTFFDHNWEVNKVKFSVTADDARAFLGAAHAHLTKDFAVATSQQSAVPDFIQRIRTIAQTHNLIEESGVTLGPVSADHKMGTGLTTTSQLTYVPDPSLGTHVYGSTPDQKEIGKLAPPWTVVVKRRFVNPANPLAVGKKPHYVLAHLINHNINGSGKDPKNVVPFYATSNTQMERVIEKHIKDLVQHGLAAYYNIDLGPKVDMTAGRQQAHKNCMMQEQRDIIETEQYLPQWLEATVKVWTSTGAWQTIVPPTKIMNFVPETVPVI